jgi:diguanylate cyclase (GGDEF)-like protein
MGIRAKSVLTPAEVERRAACAAPERPQSAAPVRAAPAEADGSTGLRILLAGEAVARDAALKQALAAAGNSVSAALDVHSALAATLEGAPHMVLCDWEIAGGPGLHYVHTLRLSEAGKRPHVVVVAERRHDARLLEAFQAGADEYLLLPLDTRLVVARTQATLRAVQLDERVRDLLAERETRIGELAIAARRLQIAAVTDALTGLYNRRYATERLQKAFDIAHNGGGPLAILAIDLDRFKSVNDEYGHDTGDVVLQSVARAMARILRKGDALCRMGGEEFLAICPGATITAAAEIGERLATGLRANVIHHGRFERAITGSIGVAELTSAHVSIDDLLKAADQRVYLAKEAGRDRVVAADPPSLLRVAG